MKRSSLTKQQRAELQDGCEVEGVDYYFLECGDFSKIKDPGFHLRLSEWRQARGELIAYCDLEVG